MVAKKIMEVFNGDYELLIDKLEVVNGKLMIIAPNEEELRKPFYSIDKSVTNKKLRSRNLKEYKTIECNTKNYNEPNISY